MRRYVLCDVLPGVAGTEIDNRPAVADHNDPFGAPRNRVGFRAEIPTNPDGTTVYNWTLCHVGCDRITDAMLADARLLICPDSALSTKWSSIAFDERNALKTKAEGYGVSFAELSGTNSYQDYLDRIGQTLRQTFRASDFDVVDPN